MVFLCTTIYFTQVHCLVHVLFIIQSKRHNTAGGNLVLVTVLTYRFKPNEDFAEQIFRKKD